MSFYPGGNAAQQPQQVQNPNQGVQVAPTMPMTPEQLVAFEAYQRGQVNARQQALAQAQQQSLFGQRQYQGQPGQQFNPQQAAMQQAMDPRTQGYNPMSIPPHLQQQYGQGQGYDQYQQMQAQPQQLHQQQYGQPAQQMQQYGQVQNQAQPTQAPLGQVDPSVGFDVSGLDQLLARAVPPQYAQQIVADLQAQYQVLSTAAEQRAVAAAQAQFQTQLQQVQEEAEGLREALLEQMLVGRSPQEQQFIRLRVEEARQRDENQRLQSQLQETQVGQEKAQALNYLAQKYGVHPSQLSRASNFAEAELAAIKITQAQQQRQQMQVPASQFNVGASGGVGQVFRIPHPDSPQFDDMTDQLAGRTPRSFYQRRPGRQY